MSEDTAAAQQAQELSLPQAVEMIGRMLAAGNLEAAEEMCTVVLQTWENQPDAMHLAGVIRHMQGRFEEALQLVAYAIGQMPANPAAYNSFGNTLAKLERLDEAVEAFERAIALSTDPAQQSDLHNNLARMYRKQGRMQEAEDEARLALELNPGSAVAWYNLSLILIRTDRLREGLVANGKAVALWPRNRQPRDNVIRALVLIGELDEAVKLYREWLAEEPDNALVKHHLAACLGMTEPDATPSRASDAYVQTVFDRFSSSFDAKLHSLQYRAPQEVAAALRRAVGDPLGTLDIADAGCGTGLCGVEVKPWCASLVGVDLSAGMLQKAAERDVYDALHQAELVAFLDAHPSAFDVVTSGDTLVYFGDLDGVGQAAAASLRSNGLLIFTVEALPAESTQPYAITPSGRYAHGSDYVDGSLRAAGFLAPLIEPVVLRMEAGEPVHGWLVTARRG